MKKLIAIILTLMMMLSLAACGNNLPSGDIGGQQGGENEQPGVEIPDNGGSEQGGTETDTPDDTGSGSSRRDFPELGEVNADNCAEVVKEHFGLDLSMLEGWTVTNAKVGAKLSMIEDEKELRIYFDLPEDIVLKDHLKFVFDKTLELSGGTVWKSSTDIDFDSGEPYNLKGEAYTSFEERWAEKLESSAQWGFEVEEDRICSVSWAYDYNGYTIYIYAEVSTLGAELNFAYHC